MAKAAKKSTIRNPITKEQAEAVAAAHKKPQPPPMNINRTAMPKARPSELNTQPDSHQCARLEFWLRPGLTLKDALEPEFWSQVAYMFNRPILSEGNYAGSIIDLRSQDLSVYAELFVRVIKKSGIEVHLLRSHEIGLQKVDIPGYEVRWNNSAKGYDLIRESDREVVGHAKDFATREAAKAWLYRNG